MSQAYLYNTPTDAGSLLEWSSLHQKDHFGIAQIIFEKFSGTTVLLLPIDPIPIQFDMLTWARNHQAMHIEMDNVVGLSAFDLTSVNFAQREQMLIWMNLHAQEHFNVSQRLAAFQTGQAQQIQQPLESSLLPGQGGPSVIPSLPGRLI